MPRANKIMGFQGLGGHSVKSLKRYYSISPLYGLIGTAVGLGVFMGVRTLATNPEVIIDHRHSHPWDDYREKQYKLIGSRDVHSPAPADWMT